MKIRTFFYTIGQGVLGIFKNKWFTVATVATISACLFVFGIFYNDGDQVLAFMRGDLVFVFNFSPTRSFTDYGFLVPTGSYDVVLNTDAVEFGGNGFADDSVTHFTNYDPLYVNDHKEWLKLYIPARSAVVLKKN